MAIKIGHASYDENSRASGGSAGDQTGKEVCTRTWYSSPWNVVLRPKNADLAEKSARACEAACANSKIGYDQGSRNTLYHYAKLVDFDLSKIKDACECDCSSLMHVCAIAGGAKLSYGINGFWTGNMVDGIMASGDYEKLTASKYLTSDAYLKRGDILIRESGHTAMALENGAQAGGNATSSNKVTTSATTSKPAEVTKVTLTVRQLEKGCVGEDVRAWQHILNGLGCVCGEADGDFGTKTDKATKEFQKRKGLTQDGKVGKKTWGVALSE